MLGERVKGVLNRVAKAMLHLKPPCPTRDTQIGINRTGRVLLSNNVSLQSVLTTWVFSFLPPFDKKRSINERGKQMKIKILNGTWKIIPVDNKDLIANTRFPERVIRYNLNNIENKQMFKHCMLHEIAHAYQGELGQWQNALSNGRLNDEFDCEWIAEFVAIYAESILNTYEKIKHLWKDKDVN